MLMMGKQLTTDQRLTKAVVDIMGKDRYVALGGLLMIGERAIRDDIPTACTNGRDEFYGKKFVDELNDSDLRGLVLHENYHKLFRHLTTWKNLHDINHRLANMACDYVINLKIVDENKGDGFATLPKGGLIDERFRDMSAAQVFNILLREQQQQQNGNGSGQPQPKQPGGNPQPGTGIPNESAGLDEHDWEGAAELSDEDKKELEREIEEAIRQGALAAGKLGTGGDRDIAELLKSKVDWRDALREFIQTFCVGNDFSTWNRPNRRFISSGMYMPSGITERMGQLVIAVDTSGSIGGDMLNQFLGEVQGICETVKPEAIRLLYWGTEVVRDEKYEGDEIANLTKSTKPAGGGGTAVSCVSDYIAEHRITAQAVVVLTDGYLGSDWGALTMPTLWCVVDNKRATAPYGKTLHVEL